MSAYLSLIGGRKGWALIRGWALINFSCFKDGRLFEVGANSRLGAYSNKYGRCYLAFASDLKNTWPYVIRFKMHLSSSYRHFLLANGKNKL